MAAAACLAAGTGAFTSRTQSVTVVRESAPSRTGGYREGSGVAALRIYERAAPGVVLISSRGGETPESASEYSRGEGAAPQAATGTGFEVDRRGDILTNWHVVRGASEIRATLGEHGKALQAAVVGKDPSSDLSLLRVSAGRAVLNPLPLGDSSAVRVGEPVLAIGNPFGYGRTLTNGIISALGRDIQAPNGATIEAAIQTDVPINPGSSGGPLLNDRGEVIGINSQIVTSGSTGGNVGIAFAIPIDVAEKELGRLGSE